MNPALFLCSVRANLESQSLCKQQPQAVRTEKTKKERITVNSCSLERGNTLNAKVLEAVTNALNQIRNKPAVHCTNNTIFNTKQNRKAEADEKIPLNRSFINDGARNALRNFNLRRLTEISR